MRRYGDAPDPARRYQFRPGAYAILPRDGSLLLTHQAVPAPEFQLPGGGIEPGESPICALHREVLEETGWAIAGARRVGAFRRFTFMPDYDLWAEKLCTIYMAKPIFQRHAPTEPGHTAVWMPYRAAGGQLADRGARDILAKVDR
ncbi:NUDIX domain-containing protein [Pseudooceanicola sp.]|uniref:NUDIX domain-containing protein n=1 Tax=Pseudooceanicola sp. TaxID=1914328 RepID=UPI004059DB8E